MPLQVNSVEPLRKPSTSRIGKADPQFWRQASWEAEELKRSVLEMEARLRQAESLAETAGTEQKELETQLAEAKGRIKDLEFKARECETIPGLWKHISENTTQIKSMEVVQVALEVRKTTLEPLMFSTVGWRCLNNALSSKIGENFETWWSEKSSSCAPGSVTTFSRMQTVLPAAASRAM